MTFSESGLHFKHPFELYDGVSGPGYKNFNYENIDTILERWKIFTLWEKCFIEGKKRLSLHFLPPST